MSKLFLFLIAFLLAGCGLQLGFPEPVKKADENKQEAGKLRIFVTAGVTRGNMGGAEGADELCRTDSNRPSTGTFYALLADGTHRIAKAGEQKNWVLRADTKYVRPDGLAIGSTDANGHFKFRLERGLGTVESMVWTGLTSNWDMGGHCNGWTSQANLPANAGQSLHVVDTAIHGASATCDMQLRLYCVEQ